MSLEAETLADSDPTAPARVEPPERRSGRDRRKTGGRINREAPRRSVVQRWGVVGVSALLGLLLLLLVGSELLLDEPPWVAIATLAFAWLTSILAFLIGCLEQRLIEIRLELMMANGGSRKDDRRGRSAQSGDLLT